MSNLLIRLKDGGIVNVESEETNFGGCSTCDYGSHYVNRISIEFVNHNLNIRTDTMYEYAISVSEFLKIILRREAEFPKLTEMDFISYIGKEVLGHDVYARFTLDGNLYFPDADDDGEKLVFDNFEVSRNLENLKVNGKDAELNEFGETDGNVFRKPSNIRKDTAEKYGLSFSEFWKVTDVLYKLSKKIQMNNLF